MPTAPKKFSVLGPAGEAAARRARERERGTAAERGYKGNWPRYAKWFRELPENVICACGCNRPSEVVDHIIAVGPEDPRFMDMTNHQALTKRCHNRKTRRFDDSRGVSGTAAELQAMLAAARARAEKIQARRAASW